MKTSSRQILTCILLWAAIVACASALWRQPLPLTGVYVAASLVLLTLWRSRQERAMYALGFVLGPGGEILAVYHGAWQYADSPWLVPVWLPPAWGLAALILLKLARAVGPESPRT